MKEIEGLPFKEGDEFEIVGCSFFWWKEGEEEEGSIVKVPSTRGSWALEISRFEEQQGLCIDLGIEFGSVFTFTILTHCPTFLSFSRILFLYK